MAPRKRNKEHAALADYPGLHRRKDGRFFMVNPLTGKHLSLDTRDFKKAKLLWATTYIRWKEEQDGLAITLVQERIIASSTPKSRGDKVHLADYIRDWRREVLGYDKIDGIVVLQPTKVLVTIKRNRGKPIKERTQRDYGKIAMQLEESPNAGFPLAVRDAKPLRKLLADWLETPVHYNHMLAVLSRVYQHAISAGITSRNPIKDIDTLPTDDREVTIPDDVYNRICAHLRQHKINRRTFDGEWRVRIIDLMFFMSQQPIDVFSVTEDQLHLNAGKHGELHVTRHKTDNAGIIEMNADMRETVDWLLAFKRRELAKIGKVVAFKRPAHLLICPAYFDRRSRWQPVKQRLIADYWRAACKAVGVGGEYRMTDLRRTGLTLEYANQGKNDKGIHDTDAMAMHYVATKPPKRSKNTLTQLRKKPDSNP